MNNKHVGRWVRWSTSVAMAILLTACGGGGDTGPAGPVGPPGPPGPAGSTSVTVAKNDKTPTDASIAAWTNMAPQVSVTSVKIDNAAPVVEFKVVDGAGVPVVGLGNTSKSATASVAGLTNLAFSLAKLVPGSNGSPSKWVSYIVTTVPTTTAAAAATRPSTDNTGTLVDNLDGSYKYTFYRDITKIKDTVAAMTFTGANKLADLGDLSYEANLVHRLSIQLAGNAPGTGSNTPTGAASQYAAAPMTSPKDLIYDFVPATGEVKTMSGRDIVANAKCEECHRKLGGIPGDTSSDSGAMFHGGSRNEVRYCVMCHTDQRKYGRTEATYNAQTMTLSGSTNLVDGRSVFELPNMIHKTHMGGMLAKKGYNAGGVLFNEIGYPQDIRNCTKCHDGSATSTAQTAQGDNWKSAPSVYACGSCHDGINFATGTGVTLADAAKGLTSSTYGHPAGPQPDNSQCALCHKPSAVDLSHLPVTPPNTGSALHVAGGNTNTNAAWIASNTSRLPPGAIKVSYEVQSVSRNASKRPVIVFRMLQDGSPVPLNDFATTTANPFTGSKEIWTNFMGSPSVYFVFAVPQDGIAKPADFNASASGYLKNLWNGTASGTGAGTLTGPDANGYYTATLTNVQIPDSAVMLTGGVGYSYNVSSTLPLTQTNVTGYPVSASPAGAANEIGGLIVITPNSQKVATGYTGRRAIVEDTRCNACHQELGTFTEDAFHAGQRNDATTCAWCHTPNRASSGWSADSASFVHAIHANAKRKDKYTWHAISATEGFWDIAYPGILKECEACHLPGTYDLSAATSVAAAPNRLYRTVASGTLASTGATYSYSPDITQDVNYGAGFSFNAATGATTAAAATTLVTSPITTACFACHDSPLARSHMKDYGGSIYEPRSTSTLAGKTEGCMLCHDAGRIADIKAMHKK